MIAMIENKALFHKYENLKDYLAKFGSVAVAFSSGVDSTFLLYAAKEALGDSVIAITAASCLFPKRELNEAKQYCETLGVRHYLVEADELSIEGFCENPTNRCYICKRDLFGKIIATASAENIFTVVEGSNLDDLGDYRPGLQAIAELDVKSPLRAVGFTKKEIRELSEYFKLPTWNKPSFACLASRFPYGEIINEKKLNMVDRSEQFLLDLGFHQLRVRIHGESVARIELPNADFARIMEPKTREIVYKQLKEYGFSYVSLDLFGYRTGSMNETIEK